MSTAPPCPLCDSHDLESLFEETWPIVAMSDVRIGISLCRQCGFVFQNPAVPQAIAQVWYSRMNNYINPSRQGRPPPGKIRIVEDQIAFASASLKQTGTAWQVGSSDGYTLSRFHAAGWRVRAIEPSAAANRLAETLYGVETFTGLLEDYIPHASERCDLLIMTHVLEHLYSPDHAMLHAARLLKDDGHLLIEVPSVTSPDEWCAGFFSFEHVSYFSPATITRLLLQNGFDLVTAPQLAHDFHGNPALRCLARKRSPGQPSTALPPNDYLRAQDVCRSYWVREQAVWRRNDALIKSSIEGDLKVVIWGAGIHTSQLLTRCPSLAAVKIEFIADNDPQKQGHRLGLSAIRPVSEIDFTDPDLVVIISTHAGEAEILKTLSERPDLRARIVPLYHSLEKLPSGATTK
jgi:SAM-dependent methyltransferase